MTSSLWFLWIDSMPECDRHHHGVYFRPVSVNFYNIEYRELDANATASGTYSCKSGHSHTPGPPTPVGDFHDPARGTRGLSYDQAYSGDCDQPGPSFDPGSISWSIPYEYRVLDNNRIGYTPGAWHGIRNITQVHTLADDRSTLTARKAGAQAQISVSTPVRVFVPPVI